MEELETKMEPMGLPCCPELETDDTCDVLDFHYRLVHNTDLVANDRRVAVEVMIHARLERCPGPMVQGDLVYSTTLLPGEKVRLFTADRRTRYSFDSETSLSYRHEQTSEERYYMASMDDFMSDVTVKDFSRATNTKSGSFEGHGSTSGAIESFFAGASVDVSGSYNAQSTSEFFRELNQHVEASHHRSVEATRTANSVSVGEVQTRSHAEGESESHFESASRVFANPNRCHAVTFFFYQINKMQTIRFKIESITRRVIDPAVDTRVTNNRFVSGGGVSAVPSVLRATDKERLEIEEIGRASFAARASRTPDLAGPGRFVSATLVARPLAADPLPEEVRLAALRTVDEQLVAVGLLDQPGGQITKEARQEFSFVRRTSLPTPGVIVKGCLDECNICEPARELEIRQEIRRKRLENDLLEKQIDLLEQSQEYRCCPVDSEDDDD